MKQASIFTSKRKKSTQSTKNAQQQQQSSLISPRQVLLYFALFLTGCFFSTTIILFSYPLQNNSFGNGTWQEIHSATRSKGSSSQYLPPTFTQNDPKPHMGLQGNSIKPPTTNSNSILSGKRILIAITSFNFSQFPLLEEVLDSYQGLCFAGASKVDIYIYTTVPYTVALIDLLNTRLNCETLQIYIVLKTPALRLNLVDCHRTLFYDKIDEYDLFIYSEDDILVSPTTVATYLLETNLIEERTSQKPAQDYNIGIVRYEYNYPPDVIIDDKTRHATESVTRVYWEHLWRPLVPKSVHLHKANEILNPKDVAVITKHYVTMDNAHQGMFLATPELLRAWRKRPGCQFDVIRQRPGMKNRPSQPSEGTQRVWMSSRMLHGRKHCNVKQLIPIRNFNQLTVWHLPNKNYRRVGKKGRIGGVGSDIENEFGTGKESFLGPDPNLPTAMELHLEMRKAFGYPDLDIDGATTSDRKYQGIIMLNEVDLQRRSKGSNEHIIMVDDRMSAYNDYVARGGILADVDIQNWKWTLERN